jgi:hypothetical protein
MVERDPNLLRGRKLLVAVAGAISVLFVYVASRDHFAWYAHVLLQLLPLSLLAGAILELTGWSSARRIQRTLRSIRNSPAGAVCWTRRRAAAIMAIFGVVGFAVGLAWLAYVSHEIAIGVAAGVIATAGYFIIVTGVNTYVLRVHSGRVTVAYRPLPHLFGTVDVLVLGDWRIEADTAWRRSGYAEYTLRLFYDDTRGSSVSVKLGVVDSYEEVQLLRARISELILADRNLGHAAVIAAQQAVAADGRTSS